MNKSYSNRVLRDIYARLIRVHLLYHAAQAPIAGVEMFTELRRHGYRVSPGTLYPILHGLERAGYMKSARRLVRGKLRRYYRITPEGRRVLKLLRRQIRELVDEIFER